MGGYYGSGTIIKRGSFSSFDPAEDAGNVTNKKTIKSSSKHKKTANSKSANIQNFDKERKNLLNFVIDRILAKEENFKLPKDLCQELVLAISKLNGPLNWAKKQHDFNKTFTKKMTVLNQKSKNKEISREKKRIHQIRSNFIKCLIDQILKNEFPLHYTVTEKNLLNDIARFSDITKWLNAQPEYYKIYQQRSQHFSKSLEKARNVTKRIPSKTNLILSESQIYALGKRRIIGSNPDIPADVMATLIKNLGQLPKQPTIEFKSGNGKKPKNKRSKKKNQWLNSMNSIQKEAWNSLKQKHQIEYFATGKVRLAKSASITHKTLNDASPQEIIKLNRKKDEPWDYKKIDWDNT